MKEEEVKLTEEEIEILHRHMKHDPERTFPPPEYFMRGVPKERPWWKRWIDGIKK